MNTPISTAAQIEFAQIFERLAREFKMKKSAVAQSLHIHRSYVTMIIKGQRTPHIRTLEAMRGLEMRLKGSGEKDDQLRRLMEHLRNLKESDPATFEVAKRVVESLAQTSSQSVTPASTKRSMPS